MTQQTEFFRDSLADGHVEYVRPGLARRYDPATSHEAAEKVGRKLTELESLVIGAYDDVGNMSGKECERLDRFKDMAPSTIRHRVTDLHRKGRLQLTGERRDGCSVYEKVI